MKKYDAEVVQLLLPEANGYLVYEIIRQLRVNKLPISQTNILGCLGAAMTSLMLSRKKYSK